MTVSADSDGDAWYEAGLVAQAVEKFIKRLPSSHVDRFVCDVSPGAFAVPAVVPAVGVTNNRGGEMFNPSRVPLVALEMLYRERETHFVAEGGRRISVASLLGPPEDSRLNNVAATLAGPPVPLSSPLPPGCFTHVFLSHYQAEAKKECVMFSDDLARAGLKGWLDRNVAHHPDAGQRDLGRSSMRKGVQTSAMYLLFLTPRVLERHYVRMELQAALEDRKPIAFVQALDFFDYAVLDNVPPRVDDELEGVNGKAVAAAVKRLKEEVTAFKYERDAVKADAVVRSFVYDFLYADGGARCAKRVEIVERIAREVGLLDGGL